ncbi:hypothetical protein HanRHA438_Chr15g0710791 [Helianthus annuus]|nr:hypothetical protein HanRHA438_Chr15g0710791 [Helianthus annuus]
MITIWSTNNVRIWTKNSIFVKHGFFAKLKIRRLVFRRRGFFAER